ncbi:MAG: hypothetical protein H7Z71_00320, partial [Moraxellaceae bacterium]|nr:hypothetical protein [Pseudobdellovibrionaceae bacterium]
MMNKEKSRKIILILGLVISTVFISNCKGTSSGGEESFAPGNLPTPVISSINVNNGGAFYCSISGGCPLVVTGKNFFKKSKVYVGN